jgi:hypothetical protein
MVTPARTHVVPAQIAASGGRASLRFHTKFGLQNRDDELAGRKVVIDQNDFVEARAFDPYLVFSDGLGDDVSHRATVHQGARRAKRRSREPRRQEVRPFVLCLAALVRHIQKAPTPLP